MSRKTHKLPSKLSEVLGVAIKDMAKIAKLRDRAVVGHKPVPYRISMGHWHEQQFANSRNSPGSTVCAVCFAGSVMAGSLGVSRSVATTPGHLHDNGEISERDRNRLYALNALRQFEIADAMATVGIDKIGPGQKTMAFLDRCTKIEREIRIELGLVKPNHLPSQMAITVRNTAARINSAKALAKPEGVREFLKWMRKLQRALAKRGL